MKSAVYHYFVLNCCAVSSICSVNLTTVVEDNTCPYVVLTCSAVNLPSRALRWFFDDDVFAIYAFRSHHQYPQYIKSQHHTFSGDIEIKMLWAAPSDNSPDIVSFLSTVKVNFSALKVAGIGTISCGRFAEFRSSVKVNYTLNLVPQIPIGLLVQPLYGKNYEILEIEINWIEVISKDAYCHHEVNYTVFLSDGQGRVEERAALGYDSCEDGICPVSLFPSSSDLNYTISVSAYSTAGSSDPAVFNNTIYGSIASLIDYSLTTDKCITSVFCSTILPGISNCTIQHSLDFDYLDLGPSTTGSLNSSFSLPVSLRSSTLYYIQITFSLNFVPAVLQGNYTTDKGPPKFSGLSVFLVLLGLILYFEAITVAVVIISFLFKKQWQVVPLKLKVYISVPQSILLLLLIALWIAALACTGAIRDTCDPFWQQLSNGLLISTVAVSILVAIIVNVTAMLVYFKYRKNPKNLESSIGREGVIEMKKNRMYGINRSKHGISVSNNAAYEMSTSSRFYPNKTSNYRSENNIYSHIV